MTLFEFAIARRYGQLVKAFETAGTFKAQDAREMEILRPIIKQYEACEVEGAS